MKRRTTPHRLRHWALMACLGLPACSMGSIEDSAGVGNATGGQPGQVNGSAGSGVSPTGGKGGSTGSVGGTGGHALNDPGAGGGGGVTTPGSGDPDAAGPLPLRRLTRREYNNTVRDLLGDRTNPADQFPTDQDDTFTFRRAGLVSLQDATVVRSAAETLAAAAVANLGALLSCDTKKTGEPACARQFVDGFGLRAYRRPLSTAEGDHLMTLYQTGRGMMKLDFPGAIGLLVEAILQSPAFLYHWESPPGAVMREGALVRLGPYEMASRLSYFLLGTMPDQGLFDAASAGKLSTAAEVETQARRLLKDDRAKETVAAFFGDWLDLDTLPDKVKSATLYKEFTTDLKASMVAETKAFVTDIVFNGDAQLGSLFGAKFSFLNQSLGGLYGIAGVTGATLQRTTVNPAERMGLLTQPSFLAVTAATDGSLPPRRGKAIFNKFLCGALPPPPGDVPPAKPSSAGGTTRQRFEEHDKSECARGCHNIIEPFGFAFEHYDGIGRYRTMDNGGPVDSSGSVAIDGAMKTFADALELGAILGQSDTVRRCMVTQWTRFALSRPETDADQASLSTALAAFASNNFNLRELMVSITTARSFRYRSLAPGEVLP